MPYKLGSLFDGSGGFPLSGSLCGIEPRWAAEVEPYPIAVTRTRFPNMRHLGDISKVSGADIEPVDIITFGSPCQDLSVAGKRAGLKHEANGDDETTRSGLFMEAVRIIKEMRRATNGIYPRYALWENVPGAFSSNKGEDFRIVCEELIKVVEPSASMPSVPQKGWAYADSYIGDGWSLAYRVFDAQYWGVPQRRRRIHLVVDFRGTSAREVLFEREGVRGYFETGRTPWQTAPAYAQNCPAPDDREGEGFDGTDHGGSGRGLDVISGGFCPEQSAKTRGIGWEEEMAPTLRAGVVPGVVSAATLEVNCGVSTGRNGVIERGRLDAVAYTLKMRAGCEGGGKGALVQTDKSATLATNNDQYLFQPVTLEPIAINQHAQSDRWVLEKDNTVQTLPAAMGMGGGHGPLILAPTAYSFDSLASNSMKSSNPHSGCREVEVAKTLDTTNPSPNKNQGGIAVVEPVAYSIENHPADSRVNIDESGKVQTLTSRMGTGGGNVPMVMEQKPVYCLQGNGIDRADTAGCNGKGWKEDQSYTLNTIDRPAVAYLASGKDTVGTLMATAGTKMWLGNQEAFSGDYHIIEGKEVRYIVRRLTPTECARLQGFADRWGDIEKKDSFTPEEYEFWLNVRNTHAAINGKKVQDYTEQQMVNWYNKLQSDANEYKMWGNGIALPPALYCMQGIVDALSKEEDDDAWLL